MARLRTLTAHVEDPGSIPGHSQRGGADALFWLLGSVGTCDAGKVLHKKKWKEIIFHVQISPGLYPLFTLLFLVFCGAYWFD